MISREVITSSEKAGTAAENVVTAVSASASVGVGFLGLLGMDLLHPLLAIFQIFKLISRLKLINISWGALLDTFLEQIGNLFQIPGSDEEVYQDEGYYKYRSKLDEQGLSLMAVFAIYDKYLLYLVCLIFKFASKRVLVYQHQTYVIKPLDKLVLRGAMLLMTMAVGVLSLDIVLFSTRSLLHSNPSLLFTSNRVTLNHLTSFFFLCSMLFTLAEMLSCNFYFKTFLASYLQAHRQSFTK